MPAKLAEVLQPAAGPIEAIRLVRDWLEQAGYTEAGAKLHEETFVAQSSLASVYWNTRYREIWDEAYNEGFADGEARAEMTAEVLP